ncbi:GNAT family N-acetyltransferase [Roseateles koreensis]|uniref:GNAT family N-acetyltransferase n=1 Tax=Roseateles koreensis TaxID=2987526 RepID=A0ABT5KUZ5_9BURK|nr:GNAT family N-acetyltransferase [Roseateles koreensis]MDC8786753.1 GNAT family N-acetyltransferase [Roseateles koreensis]
MPISWSFDIESIDWQVLEDLYRVAPLGNKSAAQLQTVFTNSRFKCFAYNGTELVGAGRALADGADCSYICDVAVLPTWQGTGLGKGIVNRLVEASSDHKKIILYAVPGKELFYKKLGFLRMLTAMAIFKDSDAAIARGHLSKT